MKMQSYIRDDCIVIVYLFFKLNFFEKAVTKFIIENAKNTKIEYPSREEKSFIKNIPAVATIIIETTFNIVLNLAGKNRRIS